MAMHMVNGTFASGMQITATHDGAELRRRRLSECLPRVGGAFQWRPVRLAKTLVAAGLALAASASLLPAAASAGTAWKAVTVAPLTNTQSLKSVSCPAAGFCVAVGTYFEQATNSTDGLIATFSGGSWTAMRAPLADLSPAASSNGSSSLDHVSCPAAGSCVAVGNYLDGSGNEQGLIETLSNGTWTATTAPTSGLSPAPVTTFDLSFQGLSCADASSCAAVGYYDTGGVRAGLIETLANGSWRLPRPRWTISLRRPVAASPSWTTSRARRPARVPPWAGTAHLTYTAQTG